MDPTPNTLLLLTDIPFYYTIFGQTTITVSPYFCIPFIVRPTGCWWFLEPAATILGGQQDLFVDKGSTINLTCTIQFGPEPPGYIFWYHDHKVSVAFFLILYLQFMGGLFFFDCHSFSFCHSFIWFNVYSTQSTQPTLSCWRNNKNNITTLIVLLSFRFSTVHYIHCTVYTVHVHVWAVWYDRCKA